MAKSRIRLEELPGHIQIVVEGHPSGAWFLQLTPEAAFNLSNHLAVMAIKKKHTFSHLADVSSGRVTKPQVTAQESASSLPAPPAAPLNSSDPVLLGDHFE